MTYSGSCMMIYEVYMPYRCFMNLNVYCAPILFSEIMLMYGFLFVTLYIYIYLCLKVMMQPSLQLGSDLQVQKKLNPYSSSSEEPT